MKGLRMISVLALRSLRGWLSCLLRATQENLVEASSTYSKGPSFSQRSSFQYSKASVAVFQATKGL